MADLISLINRKKAHYLEQTSQKKLSDTMFFVWIGNISIEQIEYISVWKSNYPSINLKIYVDYNFLAFGLYKSHVNHLASSYSIQEKIAFQNKMYRAIIDGMEKGESFEETFISCFDISCKEKLKLSLRLMKLKIDIISREYDIHYIDEGVFYNRFLYERYLKELILRQNAASASDIARLSILYFWGGTYIDVDTLPKFSTSLGEIGRENPLINLHNVVRSEMFLRKLRKEHNVSKKLDSNNVDVLVNAMKLDCSSMDPGRVQLSEWTYQQNLFSMATFDCFGEFNNNLISCVKGSKLTRIIIREMINRYKIIEKYNYDLIEPSEVRPVDIQPCDYYKRLASYREDAMTDDDNVTLFLSGPSLILETVMACTYEVLRVPKQISPLAVSYLLSLNFTGFPIYEHTNFTPQHMRSSWM
ncbi:TcdA/TcdB catalytic glycosyltransferase domain-containing protein [Vibrio maritimus]|uniref:TcdA/TcdB catalytic glycosyltransferase domain-containing protein n=1 Tax=Vibrio maritimus TaxID=990268 RepID=UPI0040686CE6